jgi:hypothetical protein
MSNTIGCSEFVFTVKELEEAWNDLNKTLVPIYAAVQWAKKRDLIDDPQGLRFLLSTVEDLERFGGVNEYINNIPKQNV